MSAWTSACANSCLKLPVTMGATTASWYSDVDSWIIPFQINRARTKADTTVYLALADISVTCGKSFVMPVEKVASPEAATLTVADDVELPAPIYFRPVSN